MKDNLLGWGGSVSKTRGQLWGPLGAGQAGCHVWDTQEVQGYPGPTQPELKGLGPAPGGPFAGIKIKG